MAALIQMQKSERLVRGARLGGSCATPSQLAVTLDVWRATGNLERQSACPNCTSSSRMPIGIDSPLLEGFCSVTPAEGARLWQIVITLCVDGTRAQQLLLSSRKPACLSAPAIKMEKERKQWNIAQSCRGKNGVSEKRKGRQFISQDLSLQPVYQGGVAEARDTGWYGDSNKSFRLSGNHLKANFKVIPS